MEQITWNTQPKQKRWICNFWPLHLTIQKMSGYLQSSADESGTVCGSGNPGTCGKSSLGRAQTKGASREPGEALQSSQHPQPPGSSASELHTASVYELLCAPEGKWLHLFIPWGCRIEPAAAKNHLRVCKEIRTHLSSLGVTLGLKFHPAQPYSYLFLHVGREKILHQGKKLLNDTQLNSQFNYFSHFESLGY